MAEFSGTIPYRISFNFSKNKSLLPSVIEHQLTSCWLKFGIINNWNGFFPLYITLGNKDLFFEKLKLILYGMVPLNSAIFCFFFPIRSSFRVMWVFRNHMFSHNHVTNINIYLIVEWIQSAFFGFFLAENFYG